MVYPSHTYFIPKYPERQGKKIVYHIIKKLIFDKKRGIVPQTYLRKDKIMFVSSALAQVAEGAASQTSSATGMIFQLVIIVFAFYFLFIRPQQKRIKKHEAELKAIIKGTKIIVGGLLGKVVAVQDEEKLLVEFADGVQITVLRAYVSQVLFETPLNQK